MSSAFDSFDTAGFNSFIGDGFNARGGGIPPCQGVLNAAQLKALYNLPDVFKLTSAGGTGDSTISIGAANLNGSFDLFWNGSIWTTPPLNSTTQYSLGQINSVDATPANNTFKITIGTASVSVTGTVSAVATATALVTAAKASTDPLFTSIQWFDDGTGEIIATKSVPFVAVLSKAGNGTGTVTDFVTRIGPYGPDGIGYHFGATLNLTGPIDTCLADTQISTGTIVSVDVVPGKNNFVVTIGGTRVSVAGTGTTQDTAAALATALIASADTNFSSIQWSQNGSSVVGTSKTSFTAKLTVSGNGTGSVTDFTNAMGTTWTFFLSGSGELEAGSGATKFYIVKQGQIAMVFPLGTSPSGQKFIVYSYNGVFNWPGGTLK